MNQEGDLRGLRPNTVKTVLWASLMRLRPAQLGVLGKKLFRVRRGVLDLPSGHKLWIDPASQLGQALLKDHAYEPGTLATMTSVLRAGDTFVDIGANEGYFTVIAAGLVGGGKVVAVEPQTRLGDVLFTNLKLNHASNVTVRQVALSVDDGERVLHLRPTTNTGASSFHQVGRIGKAKEVVPTMSLDNLLRRDGITRVRLVKIDCEGAEEEVIKGAEYALDRQAFDYILIDYHPQLGEGGEHRSRRVHARIISSGYLWSQLNGADFYRRPEAPPPTEASDQS